MIKRRDYIVKRKITFDLKLISMILLVLFIIITIMFSVMYIFELYTLRDYFVCEKEEVSLIEK